MSIDTHGTSALAIVPTPQQRMSTLLIANNDLGTVKTLAEIATASGLAKVSNSTQAMFIILKGLELGVQPFTALEGIFAIETENKDKGRKDVTLGLTVSLMMALVEASGKLEDMQLPDPARIVDSATVMVKRVGRSPFTFTFTKQMATDQWLLNKPNWKKMYPLMMMNRAISGALRPVFPDVLKGMYLIEEVAPDVQFDDDGAPIEVIKPSNITTLPVQHEDIPEGEIEPEVTEEIKPQPHYLTTKAAQDRLRELFTELNITHEDHELYLEIIEPDNPLSRFSETTLNEIKLHDRIREIHQGLVSTPPAKPMSETLTNEQQTVKDQLVTEGIILPGMPPVEIMSLVTQRMSMDAMSSRKSDKKSKQQAATEDIAGRLVSVFVVHDGKDEVNKNRPKLKFVFVDTNGVTHTAHEYSRSIYKDRGYFVGGELDKVGETFECRIPCSAYQDGEFLKIRHDSIPVLGGEDKPPAGANDVNF